MRRVVLQWEPPKVESNDTSSENSIGDLAIIGLGALALGGAAFLYCDVRYGLGLKISWDGWKPTSVGCG